MKLLHRQVRSDFLWIDPWGWAYVLMRTLTALGTLLTLSFNGPSILFHPRIDAEQPPVCVEPLGTVSMLCQGSPALWRYVGIAVLLLVLSGWRPRLLALPHVWVTWSVSFSISLPEGGDQVASNLALLLLPLALADGRRWVWRVDPHRRARLLSNPVLDFRTIFGLSVVVLVRLQACVIYLDAAVSKFRVTEWQDGTAIYYWFRDPLFVPGDVRDDIAFAITSTPVSTALITWGGLALELALAAAIFAGRRSRRVLLVLGLAFHGMIAIVFGLVTFWIAMAALLVMYLGFDNDFPGLRRRAAQVGALLAPLGRRARRRPNLPVPTSPAPVEARPDAELDDLVGVAADGTRGANREPRDADGPGAPVGANST
ncbi:HTTM domain-containing protein [Micromonospora sp. NIE79]|uniref:HTTM domain-containing protein n=1 Tax=Micromonospora trifolii TaxID=2911208 RepID=A0ABS9MXF4_9ACTN|nr:sporulation-delaying protein SdpB family protein [Micromonospora trifolii]MCG5442374.1 HTTM domain-containing protein [Micromonospora trifolii]